MLDESPVTQLTDEECWEFLRANEFGRLAFHLAGEVHIAPINYAADTDRLVFRTAEGNKLLGMTMNDDVAFETDQVVDEVATSVVVRGRAHTLEGDEADAVDILPLRGWVPETRLVVVEIRPSEVTGRRFRLDRPWRVAGTN